MPAGRRRGRGRLVLALLLAALVAAAAGAFFWARQDRTVEVAVLFGGSDNGEWREFLLGLEKELPIPGQQLKPEQTTHEVAYPWGRVVFRWYPEVGEGPLVKRVNELCDRRRPPVALVCPGNSTLAQAVVTEIDKREEGRQPVLLIPGATSDELLEKPGRRFRFAANNKAQVKKVIEGAEAYCKGMYPPKGRPPAKAFVFEVRGMAYTKDLAKQFAEALRLRPEGDPLFLGPEAEALKPTLLKDSAGNFDSVNEEEKQWAEAIEGELADPDRPVIVVLPTRGLYKRFSSHFRTAAPGNLLVLAGDLLSRELCAQLAGPATIFFEHARPGEGPSVDGVLAGALSRALERLPSSPNPAALAAALSEDDLFDRDDPQRQGERKIDDTSGAWVLSQPSFPGSVERDVKASWPRKVSLLSAGQHRVSTSR